jgi:hypothetical protein
MKHAIVYVVWGPSAEWGDGVGVIGYALTEQDAQGILEHEAAEEVEYGPRSWRSIEDCGTVEPVPAEDLGWDGEEDLAAFVERLNAAL